MPVGQDLARPWISTPGFLQDRAVRIHNGLHALNNVITALTAAHRLSPETTRYKQWKALLHGWGTWYGQTGVATWFWSGTDATLEGYERDIQQWERWLRQAYPDVAQSLPLPPPQFGPNGEERKGMPLWVGVGLGALAGFGVVMVIKRM